MTDAQADSPLLLQADELVYDRDNSTVTAFGNVQVDYGGSRMVADRLVYDQSSGRLLAIGNVEILQPDGTRVFADKFDVTDDFRDGFVNALRIVTPDETRFAAESAERKDGAVTTFNNGVYTACAPCLEHPEKPPVWQIKAQRVIWNGEEKTIRFEGAAFEFLGIPLATLPVFTTADPTVRRKTGFLTPGLRHSDELGTGVSVPYFIALAPNYDLKMTATGLARQGFLGEAEFRHRLADGMYTLKAAGIHQLEPEAFNAGTQDNTHVNRGMIGTTGEFDFNSRWSYGWNWLVQTDKNFSKTYDIDGFSQTVQRNEIYLSGLHDRNYFDLRTMEFMVQEKAADGMGGDEMQPLVLPSFDYNTIISQPVAGGELSFNVNSRGIYRDELDQRGDVLDSNFATQGLEGESARFTVETEWKRTYIATGGLALTPILAAQGDVTGLNTDSLAAYSASGAALAGDGSVGRWMVTAGLEARWPIMFTNGDSTHVVEPIAQIFVRPDETGAGTLPNEDAQSFVFDTTNLFDRDKFSGYDRIEGGTRANIGLRYTGSIGEDIALYGLVGQSYHLAGANSFASPDMMNAGADSGLETDVSDVVAMVGASYEESFTAALRGRFDESNFSVRRAEAEVGYTSEPVSASAGYAFIDAQPTYGYETDRREVSGTASFRVADFWRVSGNATFDITNKRLAESGIGFGYEDECFALGIQWNQTRDAADSTTTTIGFRLSFRTLGDLGNDLDGLGGF
ncbi:LPS-assembly protein LptD [Oricola sp.]|uniref:LPS-assembly protein LptD n=1 Tax=Oricola sp. TaxID=1979950 RepID=UPI0025D279D0|nr:LPS-assembly protein LptD [Oricola sp.]MCI5077210.1 LPS-assembly protein LptD [Oricola sp.]